MPPYLIAAVLGFIIGAWRAKRRGGSLADLAQYGIGHGFALIVVMFFILMWADFITNWIL